MKSIHKQTPKALLDASEQVLVFDLNLVGRIMQVFWTNHIAT